MHTPADEIRFPLKQSQTCNQDIVVPSNDKSLASGTKIKINYYKKQVALVYKYKHCNISF